MLRQAYKDENEEAIRLQYVAAARAAHALIIMPVAAQNNVPWFTNSEYNLVLKKDDSIKVYDYKSDAMNGKEMAAFEESQVKKYAGQLALYRYAIGKAFGVSEVETELIHLYR